MLCRIARIVCIHQISAVWQVLFLGSKHIVMNKTKITALFLHGADKVTRQLNEMYSVLVICVLEKNEWRRKIRNIGGYQY